MSRPGHVEQAHRVQVDQDATEGAFSPTAPCRLGSRTPSAHEAAEGSEIRHEVHQEEGFEGRVGSRRGPDEGGEMKMRKLAWQCGVQVAAAAREGDEAHQEGKASKIVGNEQVPAPAVQSRAGRALLPVVAVVLDPESASYVSNREQQRGGHARSGARWSSEVRLFRPPTSTS